MATTDADPLFVDTNILVYANAAESPFHALALAALETRYKAGVELWISRQIAREALSVLSRLRSPLNPAAVAALAERIRFFCARFHVAEDGPQVTEILLTLFVQVGAIGKQIHDANIVATMQAHGIRQLLTHNTADFARYAHLIQVLPLVA